MNIINYMHKEETFAKNAFRRWMHHNHKPAVETEIRINPVATQKASMKRSR